MDEWRDESSSKTLMVSGSYDLVVESGWIASTRESPEVPNRVEVRRMESRKKDRRETMGTILSS